MENITILSVKLKIASRKDVEVLVREWLSGGAFHHVATVNPEFLVEAQPNTDFRAVLNSADLSLIDGFGLLLAARFRYSTEKLQRMTGVQYCLLLARVAQAQGKSLYLLGDDKGSAQKAAEVLRKKFPSLRIVGAEAGPIIQDGIVCAPEKTELLQRISATAPDILLVAFGAPKQELWIARHRDELSSVKIAVGVGGTFDYVAGTVSYAPYIFRALGLEWLYRLCIQPQRAKRIFTAVIVFPFLFVKSLLSKS